MLPGKSFSKERSLPLSWRKLPDSYAQYASCNGENFIVSKRVAFRLLALAVPDSVKTEIAIAYPERNIMECTFLVIVWIPSVFSSGQGGTMECYKKLELPAEPVTLDDVVENNIWVVFKQFQGDFEGGLRFVLLVGFCTKRRPWPNSLKTVNVIIPRFCFGRESCSCCFWRISMWFWRWSSFCNFGGVLYKTKTLAKFVENHNYYRSPLLLQVRIVFNLFASDFKTILKGSSFCNHPVQVLDLVCSPWGLVEIFTFFRGVYFQLTGDAKASDLKGDQI